jgi:arylsulfatase A-like enzyme
MPAFRHLDAFEEGFDRMPDNYLDSYEGREHLKNQTLTVANHMSLGYDLKMECDTCTEAPINRWTSNAYQSRLDLFTDDQREKWESGYEQEKAEFASYENHNSVAFQKWKLKRYLQDYLRCILSVDESIGQINQYLKDHGLEENTIVVYTSDQGFFLGEHGLFDKRYMYEESFSTPMIAKYPKMISPRSVSEKLVMNLDLAPTFLEIAGAEVPANMQGRSLVPLFSAQEEVAWRESIYYHFYENAFGVPQHYGVRTDRYKLIRFDTDPVIWELYDLRTDPQEMNNLYGKSEFESIAQELKNEMQSLRKAYQLEPNNP